MVNLTIDGKQVTVKRTATIYEAAKEAGVDIPVLSTPSYFLWRLPHLPREVEQMKGRLILPARPGH
jgi:hypothetical protein